MQNITIKHILDSITSECRRYIEDEYGEEISVRLLEHSEAIANLLSVLANPIRISIVWLLLQTNMPVCLLTAFLNKDQSLVSHHIKKLRDYRIIVEEKRGKFRVYKINPKVKEYLRNVIEYLENIHRCLRIE